MCNIAVIIGGHGKIALRLASLLKSTVEVTSVIRDPAQAADIEATGATPAVLSLENDPVEKFSALFEGSDVVVFSAGAGGRDGPERTKAVDYEGAVKVFDAIEAVQGRKPRLLLVSAIDVRDRSHVPEHYNEEDIKASEWAWTTGLPHYMKWKFEADKNLVQRTAFKWTILRPGHLTDTPGVGTAFIGRAHINPPISRDDVAKTLSLLMQRLDAAGLALDVVGGDTPIEQALDSAIKSRATSWVG